MVRSIFCGSLVNFVNVFEWHIWLRRSKQLANDGWIFNLSRTIFICHYSWALAFVLKRILSVFIDLSQWNEPAAISRRIKRAFLCVCVYMLCSCAIVVKKFRFNSASYGIHHRSLFRVHLLSLILLTMAEAWQAFQEYQIPRMPAANNRHTKKHPSHNKMPLTFILHGCFLIFHGCVFDKSNES